MTDFSPKAGSAAVRAADVEARVGSGYPEPLAAECRDRIKRILGDVFGLTQFGVNLTTLPSGAWSSQRHWHEHEDEFIYVIEGELVLVSDDGEETLEAGTCAGFPAGRANGHHLVNRSGSTASYLEIGTRSPNERSHYPDVDLEARKSGGSFRFTRRNGEPYET
ncbi:MAG: cupin domain-containing protein [Alphaproteobacteria bacterium]|nr:cupin domain-containing protein [Alphaproteobacteria bacterium]